MGLTTAACVRALFRVILSNLPSLCEYYDLYAPHLNILSLVFVNQEIRVPSFDLPGCNNLLIFI